MNYSDAERFILNLGETTLCKAPDKINFSVRNACLKARQMILMLNGNRDRQAWQQIENEFASLMDSTIVAKRTANGYTVPCDQRDVYTRNLKKNITSPPSFDLSNRVMRQAGGQTVIATALILSVLDSPYLHHPAVSQLFRGFIGEFGEMGKSVLDHTKTEFDNRSEEMRNEMLTLYTGKAVSLARLVVSISTNSHLIEYEKQRTRLEELWSKADRIPSKAMRMIRENNLSVRDHDALERDYDW